MTLLNQIRAFADEMKGWRRDFHAHPEIAFEEHRTAAIIASKLSEWGLEVETGIGRTGVVGTLRVGSGNRSVGIRADIDALPMDEENDFEYRSTIPGRMHGCGHDGHTTMLLGAAKYLSETKKFHGTVHFIFQPAEEGGRGAAAMIEDGLFERFPCDIIFGAHNDPSIALGEVLVKEGVLNAAADRFTISLRGVGGHASRPHLTIDPVIIGSQIALALQTIVSRRTDPMDSAVLSVCEFHAGSAGNVIPPSAVLKGTVRTLRPEVQDDIEARMHKLVTSIAEANEASATLEYIRRAPQVVNEPGATASARAAVQDVVGEEKTLLDAAIKMGGEDFAHMSQRVAGCYIRIGQAETDKGSVPVHHPRYDFNDDILPIGAAIWATLAERELAQPQD